MKHFLSIQDLSKEEIEEIVLESLKMIPYYQRRIIPTPPFDLPRNGRPPEVATIFQESSTRTKCSFQAAAGAAGFGLGSQIDAKTSSLTKGESLMDTLRMVIQQGASSIVLRSQVEGAGRHLAHCLQSTGSPDMWVDKDISLLIGGAGTRDHPSQVILDVVTIVCRKLGITKMNQIDKLESLIRELGDEALKQRIADTLNNLRIAFVGDLIHSRVVHDWINLGKKFDNIDFMFVAPKPCQVESWCQPKNSCTTTNLKDALDRDVVYSIRLQKERLKEIMSEADAIEAVRSVQIIPSFVDHPDFNGVIMDALPLDKASPAIDRCLITHPQVVAFFQSAMGPPVRMALLRLCYQGRKEKISLFTIPRVRPKVLLSETIKAHQGKMKNRGKGVNPITHGVVIDRIDKYRIGAVDRVLELAGVYATGSGSIIPARDCESAKLGQKGILFLENRFPPFQILATLILISPDIQVIDLRTGKYRKMEFARAQVVTRVFHCPNSNCITNHDPEAETFFYRRGLKHVECAYCSQRLPVEQAISHLL